MHLCLCIVQNKKIYTISLEIFKRKKKENKAATECEFKF